MALPENILEPIPGENPSGLNLRYDQVYEKVKEARREEDDLPQGEWSRAVKVADSAAVIRWTTEALVSKSKDLQLAAWLTESLLRHDGIGGLTEGLDLLRALIEKFWDTVYPEPEDGDMELRAAPLNWVGSYLGEHIKKTPLTRSRYDWFKYLESRDVGYEEACAGDDSKIARRQNAISEKKLAPEIFDQDVASTKQEFYVQLAKDFEQALASLQSLDELCREKLGRDSPGFGSLQGVLEDVQSLARTFLKTQDAPEPEPAQEQQDLSLSDTTGLSSPVVSTLKRTVSDEPVDRDDAVRRIIAATKFLRQLEPGSPAPYLALRGLRWGELISRGSSYVSSEMEAPPSETRQKLKRLSVEGQWSELLEGTEAAMSLPCGMAWLDLQRFAIKACQEMGGDYEPVAAAIRSNLNVLLAQIPDLPQSSFADDTAVANPETIVWLLEISKSSQNANESANSAPPKEQAESSHSEASGPDPQKLAMQAARSGRMQEAMEILTQEIAKKRSGRARFEKKLQLASVCLSTGHEGIAYPILKELAQEIERRKLEEWESPNMLASSLILLFRCLNKMGGDAAEKQEIYQRICRLDPVQALTCLK